MKLLIITFIALANVHFVFAAAGELIGSTFQLPGTVSGSVSGLDKDWSDGNIWATTAVTNACQIGKFNLYTHAMVQDWIVTSPSPYTTYDCCYGYVYWENTYIILTDINSPAIRVYNPSTGDYVSSLPNAFISGYHIGLGVQAGPMAPPGNNLYCTNNTSSVARSNYPCTTWAPNWATLPGSPAKGCCYAWGKVIVATAGSDNRLYCLHASLGTLFDVWNLSTSSPMVGISAGRVNAVGNNESIFMACGSGPEMGINEIEIGDLYTPGPSVSPLSVGEIKGMFK